MQRLNQCVRLLLCSLLVLLVLSGGTAHARGKKETAPATSGEKSYVYGYLLSGLFIGLGLIAVLRPSSRSKPE